VVRITFIIWRLTALPLIRTRRSSWNVVGCVICRFWCSNYYDYNSWQIATPKAGISSNVALLRTLIADPVKGPPKYRTWIHQNWFYYHGPPHQICGWVHRKYYMDYRARDDLYDFGLAGCARGVEVYSGMSTTNSCRTLCPPGDLLYLTIAASILFLA
jgi:hypothetical protein